MDIRFSNSLAKYAQQLHFNSSVLEDVLLVSCDLSKINTVCPAVFNCLSAEEKAKANDFLSQKLQWEYKVTHSTLRILLAEILKLDAAAIPIKIHPTGKPFLAIADQKQGQLHFNISHSGHYALFAFAWNRQLGVDIEAITVKFSLPEIASQFFSAKELSLLQSVNTENYHDAFFNCWTRKEAYIKALGGGLRIPLNSFSVELRPRYKTRILQSNLCSAEQSKWQLFDLSPSLPSLGFKAAIVIET